MIRRDGVTVRPATKARFGRSLRPPRADSDSDSMSEPPVNIPPARMGLTASGTDVSRSLSASREPLARPAPSPLHAVPTRSPIRVHAGALGRAGRLVMINVNVRLGSTPTRVVERARIKKETAFSHCTGTGRPERREDRNVHHG